MIKVSKVNSLLRESEAAEGQVAVGSAGTGANTLKTKEFTT